MTSFFPIIPESVGIVKSEDCRSCDFSLFFSFFVRRFVRKTKGVAFSGAVLAFRFGAGR